MENYQSEEDRSKLPPMLRQYLEYKQEYPDCILLFQVGDFYEAFFEDAVTISKTLNLTLTSRDKSASNPTPMSGVPIAAVEGYVQRLVEQKFSVALVSQVSASNSKGAVDRKLDRIITPGVQLLSDGEKGGDAMVAALTFEYLDHLDLVSDKNITLACSYPASGRIKIYPQLDREGLLIKISQLLPTEIILPYKVADKKLDRRFGILRDLENISKNTNFKFRVEDTFSARSKQREFNQINGYSALDAFSKSACRLLLNYIDEVTVDKALDIKEIDCSNDEDCLLIDASTRKNLELIQNLQNGTKDGSLYSYLDQTLTTGGRRLLKQWILAPSTNMSKIQKCYEVQNELISNFDLQNQLRKRLALICDLERSAARIELSIISPRELAAVRDSLLQIKQLLKLLESSEKIKAIFYDLDPLDPILKILLESLAEEPPSSFKESGIFKTGYNSEIDHLFSLKNDGEKLIKELEQKEREATGINSLKIKFNNVHNYFIEVTKANLDKVPERYLRKQSTVNYERFFTDELKTLERDLMNAEVGLLNLEKKLYQELKSQLLPYIEILRSIYQKVSILDVLSGFVILAERDSLVQPELLKEPVLNIQAGRHPVLAQILQGDFVPNDIELKPDKNNFIILTGPNMGGKSTYLRQSALIVIMAQLGCFVPAVSAQIGIVDRAFARIGATDDQAEGDSTFMVEMREACQIVRNATKNSLILIDEIGRGTSTTDGRSLAQAILEWIIIEKQSRTLFATHFHSLTDLAQSYSTAVNFSVGSVDVDGNIIFTHELEHGAADKSYGIEVAKLAGLPEQLIERAYELVSQVPSELRSTTLNQLSLFEAKQQEKAQNIDPKHKDLYQAVMELDPNQLTPLQALNTLFELQSRIQNAK